MRTGPNFFVHIGKCGGRSLRRALAHQSAVRNIKVVHLHPTPIRLDANYYIVARNPVRRALSAFNWRYKLVITDAAQPDRFPGERAILEEFGTLDTLACALYDDSGETNPQAQHDFRKIHHLKEDISFYLSDLLARISPHQVRGVLLQESLDDDIERVFGVRAAFSEHRNADKTPDHQMHLGPRARANLKRFLVRDYEALMRLHCWGLIGVEMMPALLD